MILQRFANIWKQLVSFPRFSVKFSAFFFKAIPKFGKVELFWIAVQPPGVSKHDDRCLKQLIKMAEWLVYWAAKPVSRVRCPAGSSSMMHVFH